MARYLTMYLNQGKSGDRQVVSGGSVRQMLSPQMIVPSAELDPELGYRHYGLGLSVTTYRGHKFASHGGRIDGFSLMISLLPDEKSGSVVLLDMDQCDLTNVLAFHINDLLLGLPPADWNKRELDRYFAAKKSEEDARKKNYVPRRENAPFSHPLDEYVGEYADPAYGTVFVERAGNAGDLRILYHGMKSVARHWHYDVWRVPHDPLDPLQELEFMFRSGWDGEISGLSSALEPSVKDIVFVRQPDRRMRERGFLEPLAGVYRVADSRLVVARRPDDVLTALFPDQKSFELEPLRGTTFAVKGRSGETISFKRDERGSVTELALNQPGSSSVYRRER
jgi:CubicO group peptidase (beta-lactamase class C family)